MSEVFTIKRGLDIKLKGAAQAKYGKEVASSVYGIRPDDFEGLTPRLSVKVGDAVKVGTELFHDKEKLQLKVVSPVSGTVKAINRGDRRKLLNIELESDNAFASESVSGADIMKLDADALKSWLFEKGFGAFIRRRPYDITALPDDKPVSVFVSAFDSAPLAPDYDFVYSQSAAYLQKGVEVIAKAAKAPVYVGVSGAKDQSAFKNLKGVEVNVFNGPHPCGNVGVQINHVKPVNKGEVVWTVKPELLVAIGKTLTDGKFNFSKTVAVVGSHVKDPMYLNCVYGTPIADLLKGNVAEGGKIRYISGNPLTGRQVGLDEYIGAYDNQVTVIPETSEEEAFGWIMPRTNKFSTSKSYFSWLSQDKEYDLDTNINGGERAIIVSNEYDKVFPMDIYPEYLIKAILAQDIDRMIDLGIYEVSPEDFALCEFVDTSKLKVQKIVRDGLNYLRKEDA